MNKPHSALTKTCTSCGQQKPLSAFLQYAGTLGASYGNICASCRKEGQAKIKEGEESTRSSTGVIINSKLKVKEAQDKRNRWQQIEDEFFEGREEKDKNRQKQTQKVGHIAKEEKKHRETFPRTFIDNKNKTTEKQPVFGGEDHRMKEGELDFARGPVQYTLVPGLIKTTLSTPYQAFKLWLGQKEGKAPPLVTTAEKTAAHKAASTPKAKTEPASKTEPDPLNEHLNKFRSRPK